MIHQLREEGLSISAIARRVGLDRKTVRKYLKAGLTGPSYGPRALREQLLDPYRSYLRDRVMAYPGLRGTRLLREIRALGFPGGYSQLTAYLRAVRPPLQSGFEHRFETAPGKQAQVDFAQFKTVFTDQPDQVRMAGFKWKRRQTSAVYAASPKGARAYLASLSSPASRRSMRYALDQVARILTCDEDADLDRVPWNRLRYEHMAALRSRLADHYAPGGANTMLAVVRGVLRNAWRLGQINRDAYLRAIDLPPVSGTRLPAGRALSAGELRALFGGCAADSSPAGSRDAAAFALMFGAGLRRSEAVGAQLSDYNPETGALTITGKGNRQRIVYATGGGAAALAAWLKQRGGHDGALLAPVNKGRSRADSGL